MLNTLEGLDHVVIMVNQLAQAASNWSKLGFTVSPQGQHSAHLGTGNHTIVFEDDYLELLGVLKETDHNQASRDFLQRRGEGLERVAFRTNNAADGVKALQQLGQAVDGPIDFSRPVQLADGSTTEAAFSIFRWPADERAADLRIFACQHRSRNAVWVPELTEHKNTAYAIARVEVIARNPEQAAKKLAQLINHKYYAEQDKYIVDTAANKAKIVFLHKQSFIDYYRITDDSDLPVEGAAALVVNVRNTNTAAHYAGNDAIQTGTTLFVPGSNTNGIAVVFQQN